MSLITAPNGTLFRVEHIVAVSDIFESPELGTDAFAIYTVGDNANPFLVCAPDRGEGAKAASKRKAATAEARDKFLELWRAHLLGTFERN
jgi:hypothetical protein